MYVGYIFQNCITISNSAISAADVNGDGAVDIGVGN